jgi:hypothetical protein
LNKFSNARRASFAVVGAELTDVPSFEAIPVLVVVSRSTAVLMA